jgi:hypothetical protein
LYNPATPRLFNVLFLSQSNALGIAPVIEPSLSKSQTDLDERQFLQDKPMEGFSFSCNHQLLHEMMSISFSS